MEFIFWWKGVKVSSFIEICTSALSTMVTKYK